jgi:hypothetical protein
LLKGYFVPGVTPSLQSSGSSVMGNLIRHIYEPSKLILAWQAPDGLGNRTRYAVGEIAKTNGVFVLHYYFDTPDVTKAKSLGYEGYAAFNLKQPEHEKDVLAAFMRRLPPRSRADFPQYLEGLRLSSSALSDFALLGYSEAKLPSDGFSLVNPLDDAGTPNEFLLELAGYRHHEPSLTKSDIGAVVDLVPEPTNPFDQNAVAIRYGSRTIGYINRLQAPVVGKWVQENRAFAVLEKLNGTPAKPRAFIFLRTE